MCDINRILLYGGTILSKLNSESMKNSNTNLILKLIIQNEAISRADISRETQLNKATVSAITSTLIENELIVESGDTKDTGGRRAKLLKFSKNSGTVFVIDMGVNTITSSITNLTGDILYTLEHSIRSTDFDQQTEHLFEIIQQLQSNTTPSSHGVVGIAISIHGLVDNNGAIKYLPYYEWSNVDLRSRIEEKFSIPTFLNNDSNLFTLGDSLASNHSKNLLAINIDSGVGLGIIINGELYRGHTGFAGELGHMIVETNGKPCSCGNSGCLEQYISERAVSESLSTMKGQPLTVKDFVSLVNQRDSDATFLMYQFVQYMSICINNIGNLLNPSAIVIHSYIFHELPLVIDLTQAQLSSKVLDVPLLTVAEFKRDTIIAGASWLVTQKFLNINEVVLPD